MPLRTLMLLIGCNVIWSANPVLSKVLLWDFSASGAAWLRYVSAFAAYLLFVLFSRLSLRRGEVFAIPRRRMDILFLPLIGFLTFCFSPLLQMIGLSASRAIDAALITAMEPMLAILLAWLFLKERLGVPQVLSMIAALFGFALLADLNSAKLVWGGRTMGNVVLLLSIIGEAAYSVLGKNLMTRHAAVPVFGSALGFGVLLLVLFSWAWTGAPTPDFANFTLSSALAVLWLGPLATMAGYLYWMTALRQAPVAAIVITLFVQPVFGSLWGSILLGERLTWTQALGAALILMAVFAKSLLTLIRARALEGKEAMKNTAPDVAMQ